MFPEAVRETYAAEAYLAMTDGGDQPLAECHICGRGTFLLEEGCCLACGETLSYTRCGVCGEALGRDDQTYQDLCSYHRWQAENDD